LDRLGIQRTHWVGLSTGGFIGMRIAARAPERIDRIRAPTLVVGGDEDRATPPPVGRSIVARIPGAECVSLPYTGHLSTVERPDDTAMLLDRFLVE
jgi:3-oxoadipate enol-lactonase